MKRFLMCLVATLMTTIAFAGNYDTIFVKPNTGSSFALHVDTVKYPYLKGKEVTWYVGFDELDGVGEGEGHKFVAKSVNPDEIVTIDNVDYLYNKNVGTEFNKDFHIRTLTVFYGHKITKSVPISDGNTYYEKADFEGVECDTVGVLHILKPLETAHFETFDLNDASKQAGRLTEINLGDTIDVIFGLDKDKTQPLDVMKYSLVLLSEDKQDTTVIAESKTPNFKFAPTESYKNILGMVENDLGKALTHELWAINVNVLPSFEVTSLSYSTVTMEESFSKTLEGVETIDVNVLNHDSVALVVNTNEKDSKVEFTTSWNKDGLAITAEGVEVKDKTTLTFSEFVKPNMEGTYNCIISDKDGRPLKTVSFVVNAQYPTSNETIGVNVNPMRVSDKVLYLDGVKGVVRVFNMRGGLVKTIKANGGTSQVSLDLPTGVYIITNDSNKIKASI